MALATKKIIQALLYSRDFVMNIETQSEGGYEKKTERHARIWSICDARQATIYTANMGLVIVMVMAMAWLLFG